MVRYYRAFIENIVNFLESRLYAKHVNYKAAEIFLTINPLKINKFISPVKYAENDILFSKLLLPDFSHLIDKWDFSSLHPTVKDIFVNGVFYKETSQYKVMRSAVQAYVDGKTDNPKSLGSYWCRSEKDIDQYFSNLNECYLSIRDEGYKTQSELAVDKSKESVKIGDELRFAICGSGDLVFVGVGANHRFSIVKLLGVTEVKGVLVGIDERWLINNINSKEKGRYGVLNLLKSVEGVCKVF